MHLSAATKHNDTDRHHPFNDEASVVAAARNGDCAAFNVLAATYRKKIINIARNITGNFDDAEDVAQPCTASCASFFLGASSSPLLSTLLRALIY